MVILSFFSGVSGASAAETASLPSSPKHISAEDASIVDGMALRAPQGGQMVIEDEVRKYFKDTPILAEIAKCESRFRHLGENGEIIKGEVNEDDIGVMQINTFYHSDEAEKRGFDLTTFHGNMAFAKLLYEKYGTSPWKPSSACWQKYEKIAKK